MKAKKTTVEDLPQSFSLPLFDPVCSAIGLNPEEIDRCEKATSAGSDWGERESRTWTVQETEWAALVEVAGLLQRIVRRFGRNAAAATFRAGFFSQALEAWEAARNPLAPFERYFATSPAIKAGFAAWNEAALLRESANAAPVAPATDAATGEGKPAPGAKTKGRKPTGKHLEVSLKDAADKLGRTVRTLQRYEANAGCVPDELRGYSRKVRESWAAFNAWLAALGMHEGTQSMLRDAAEKLGGDIRGMRVGRHP